MGKLKRKLLSTKVRTPMGKKYEPVPDEKRLQLITNIYEKGMNISRAAKAVGIYYPTAKAINKIYLRQNRICKKTNRDRTRKNTSFKIKVNQETEIKQQPSLEDDQLKPHDQTIQEAHFSTACETTRNETSVHIISPKKEQEPEVKPIETQITVTRSNIPETMTRICPFHTPETQATLTHILKLVAKLKVKSCTSCQNLFANVDQFNQFDTKRRSSRPEFTRQNTPNFGELHAIKQQSEIQEEQMAEQETSDSSDDLVFQFDRYSQNTILRPVPVYPMSAGEAFMMEKLMDDPVVKNYAGLPVAGQKQEMMD